MAAIARSLGSFSRVCVDVVWAFLAFSDNVNAPVAVGLWKM